MSGIEVEPLTAAIGAEIRGLDLRAPLDSADRERLRQALSEHLALFFRDQPLSAAQLTAFGRQLGALTTHPFAPCHPDHPEIVVLDQVNPEGEGADVWHADATFEPMPPAAGVLQAISVPAFGGDTCFASAIAAFEALSAPLRALAEQLRGVHDLSKPLRSAIAHGHSDLNLASMQRRWPPEVHPVVLTDPASGRKGLFVNANYTTHLMGLPARESDMLLRFLCEHIRSPAFQCRFRWAPGSVAVWSNRFAQHNAVPDYFERRVMHRLNLSTVLPMTDRTLPERPA